MTPANALLDRNAATDWMMGGLTYHQIEHHLFPSMPRVNPRRAQTAVRAYCDRVGVPYLSTGIIESYAQGLRHMHDVGRQLRRPNVVQAATAS